MPAASMIERARDPIEARPGEIEDERRSLERALGGFLDPDAGGGGRAGFGGVFVLCGSGKEYKKRHDA